MSLYLREHFNTFSMPNLSPTHIGLYTPSTSCILYWLITTNYEIVSLNYISLNFKCIFKYGSWENALAFNTKYLKLTYVDIIFVRPFDVLNNYRELPCDLNFDFSFVHCNPLEAEAEQTGGTWPSYVTKFRRGVDSGYRLRTWYLA